MSGTEWKIERHAPHVHSVTGEQRFAGMELGARMTILALADGLLLHSPLSIPPSVIDHLGVPRWILAPNLFHHLYVDAWIDTGADVWAAPGLSEKRPDLPIAGTITGREHPFGDDVRVLALTCFPFSNEVVVLHEPSGTLIVTDLVFHLSESAPWATKALMRCAGGYPGCRTTFLERVAMKRDIAREEIGEILSWDFDRLIMSHGEVIEEGGKDALNNAFSWLLK